MLPRPALRRLGGRLSFLVAALALALILPGAAMAAALDRAEAEAYFDQLIGEGLDAQAFPGATLAVVQDGEFVLLKGYGKADIWAGNAPDPEKTLFRIGSITKLFTAIAILQLAEEGRIDLDQDANAYLTTVKIPDNFAEPVTVRHLLTHSGGFDADITYSGVTSDSETVSDPEQLQREIIRVRPPEEAVAYDNAALGLLGLMLADMDGKSYRAVIEERIFGPLGMSESVVGLPDDRVGDASACHEVATESWRPCQHELLRDMMQSAGDISTTAGDMAKFLGMLIRRGAYETADGAAARILSPESFASLTNMEPNRLHPEIPGLGLVAFEEGPVGRGGFGHGGAISGFFSYALVSPRDGWGVFISVNASPPRPGLSPSGVLRMARAGRPNEDQLTALVNFVYRFSGNVFGQFLPGVDTVARSNAGLADDGTLKRLAGRYLPNAATSYWSFFGRFALPLMVPANVVEVGADGNLAIDGEGPFVQIAPLLFEYAEHPDPTLRRFAFHLRDDGVVEMAAQSVRPARKLAWHAHPLINAVPMGLFMVLLLTAVWPAFRAKGEARKAACLALAAVLLFLVCLTLEMEYASKMLIISGAILPAVLWRLGLHLALIGLLVVCCMTTGLWRAEGFGTVRRIHYAALSVSGLGLVILSAYWGLIGNITG